MDVENTNARTRPIVTALKRLLRPLVRLLIDNGITYPFLTQLLKRLFVEIGERDFQLRGKPQTISRVSVLTGVHRKDVRRLLEEGSDNSPIPRSVSLGAELIATWMANPAYVDKDGTPLALPRAGKAPSFEDLVEQVHRKDVRPRAVLDELVRVGVASVDADDTVHLETDAFVPAEAFEETAYYFGRNLRDHITAAAQNLGDDKAKLPERALYYDRLSLASVDELRERALDLGMEMLRTMNAEAMRLAARDEGSDGADQRMTLGFYYLAAKDEPETGDES